MSKNITIQEGGVAKAMNGIHKIKTDLRGGGSCLWVPEDEVQITNKHITANGEYKASDDGKYGYGKVTVKVPGGSGSATNAGIPSGTTYPGGPTSAVVGRWSDGNDYVVGIDESGDIVQTKVPSSIAVTTPPTKTEYHVGETIDFSGIVVSAYDNSGNLMRQVPFYELEFPVTVAAESNTGTITSDLDTRCVMPIPFARDHGGFTVKIRDEDIQHNATMEAPFLAFLDQWHPSIVNVVAASKNADDVLTIRKYDEGNLVSLETIPLTETTTYNGKTAYYANTYVSLFTLSLQDLVGVSPDYVTPVEAWPHWWNTTNVAWTIAFGEVVSGGSTIIPVTWTNPETGIVHAGAFTITVTADETNE